MVNYFAFYKAESNPTGLSGTVGGAISNTILLPRLNTLFAKREVSSSLSVTQYRKFFIKQTQNVTLTGVYLEMANAEHSGHITFATGTATDSIANATIAPSGITFSGNFTTSVPIQGTTISGTSIPVWLKQVIPAASGDDDYVAFQLRIVGTIV